MEVAPIRDIKKITAMRKILRANCQYGPRDELLFILGINTALRISDMLLLTIGDVSSATGRIFDNIELKEKKTGKAKKFPVNKVLRNTFAGYLQWLSVQKEGRVLAFNAPLFPSRKGGKSMTRWRARQILSAAGDAVGLGNIGTHSLRKTFGYHVYQKSGGNLGLVQKLLNHSSSADTLRYIGIDREQMDNTYLELNLG